MQEHSRANVQLSTVEMLDSVSPRTGKRHTTLIFLPGDSSRRRAETALMASIMVAAESERQMTVTDVTID